MSVRSVRRSTFRRLVAVPALLLCFSVSEAGAHVPYIEHRDLGPLLHFAVPDVEQSIVVYSWIETDGVKPATDFDVFRLDLDGTRRVYVESIVPVCPGYEDFGPSFAIVAPGLPEPTVPLPFDLPSGWGALVETDVAPGEPRESFFEPFGGKSYYQGPVFDEPLPAGTYWLVYWDPREEGGDYGAVIGFKEEWPLPDILRALINTPKVRRDEELHVPCD